MGKIERHSRDSVYTPRCHFTKWSKYQAGPLTDYGSSEEPCLRMSVICHYPLAV